MTVVAAQQQGYSAPPEVVMEELELDVVALARRRACLAVQRWGERALPDLEDAKALQDLVGQGLLTVSHIQLFSRVFYNQVLALSRR